MAHMIRYAAASASHSAATAVVAEAVSWMEDLEAMKTKARANFTSSFFLDSEPEPWAKLKTKPPSPW
jgi:hypothetical protein